MSSSQEKTGVIVGCLTIIAAIAGIYKGIATARQTNPADASVILVDNTGGYVEVEEGAQASIDLKITNSRLTPILKFELEASVPRELSSSNRAETIPIVLLDLEKDKTQYPDVLVTGKKVGDYIVKISDPSWNPVVPGFEVRVRVTPKKLNP